MGASQPQAQGPQAPWETEEAGGTLLDLPTEPSPAPVSSQAGAWPGAEGGHISAVAAEPAGICYSSPRPSHTRETGGLDRGSCPREKCSRRPKWVKHRVGTQTRWPEPAEGPSRAQAPRCCAWWARQELGRSRIVAAVGSLASSQWRRPAVTTCPHSWSRSQASPARDHRDPQTPWCQGWARWGRGSRRPRTGRGRPGAAGWAAARA